MPPLPIGAMISYEPNRVPITNGMSSGSATGRPYAFLIACRHSPFAAVNYTIAVARILLFGPSFLCWGLQKGDRGFMRSPRSLIAAAALGCLLIPAIAAAQASISGLVQDSSGAVL